MNQKNIKKFGKVIEQIFRNRKITTEYEFNSDGETRSCSDAATWEVHFIQAIESMNFILENPDYFMPKLLEFYPEIDPEEFLFHLTAVKGLYFSMASDMVPAQKTIDLDEQLKKALEKEDFDLAAKIRDKIKRRKKK